MRRRTVSFAAVALGWGLASLSVPALAQSPLPPRPAAASVSTLESECARLRLELQRANAAVAALKRADRGVREDYRLREAMADAEALARKLTSAEARLRGLMGQRPAPMTLPAPSPQQSPSDGPVELEAKADLLVDEARKLTVQADLFARSASQARAKQTLRRRASGLERDPFIGIESSKRNMVLNSQRASRDSQQETVVGRGPTPQAPDGFRGEAASAPPATTSGPAVGGGGAGTATPPAAPPTPTSAPAADVGKSSSVTSPGGPPPQPTTALSAPLRALIDPGTAAEIQRLQESGQPGADVLALEKTAAALRQRAQELETLSRKLRAASGRK